MIHSNLNAEQLTTIHKTLEVLFAATPSRLGLELNMGFATLNIDHDYMGTVEELDEDSDDEVEVLTAEYETVITLTVEGDAAADNTASVTFSFGSFDEFVEWAAAEAAYQFVQTA
jgi:hypothetical protein